jgi:hypothetical protein
MLHELLVKLQSTLPFYPPILVAAGSLLLAALALWLFRRSRSSVLFSLAAVSLAVGLVVGLVGLDKPTNTVRWGELEDLGRDLVGPASFRKWEQITAASLIVASGLCYALYNMAFQEKPGERSRRQLERDKDQAKALGSAHLCQPRTFHRWKRHDAWGWTLRGQFWGAKDQRLSTRFCLNGEDIARGVAVFGPQGSGKTQGVILPAIADRMRDGHSLVVTDVQGELQPHIQRISATTGHIVIVHNPSDPAGSCAINLCDWVDNVADAKSMASVLLSEAYGRGDPFWARAATNLLAACALHYSSLGRALHARQDLRQMASELAESSVPGVKDLAADFTGSLRTQEPKLALNIMATTFNIGLAPWADPAVRAITENTDLDLAVQMATLPTVVILRSARRHMEAYGPYLGTLLRVLTTRLDDLGERSGGALPIPVGLILEEFPALGRLDSLVRDINMVRKRRISILTAAQSLAQFDHIYPGRGEAEQLLAGLATKIAFGGCDQRTAEFFSRLSGQQTLAVASLSRSGHYAGDSATASLRSRALLLPDDIIRPAKGHATIFAAYGGRKGADQAIFHARLTPFFQRRDWKLAQVQPKEPLTVPRPAQTQSKSRQPGLPPDPELGLPDQALELVEQWANSQRQRRRHDGQETTRGHSGQTDIFESEPDA